jgi:hypothetical protein
LGEKIVVWEYKGTSRVMEDNKELSPHVKAAMKEHNANCCLTFTMDNVAIKAKEMIVNWQRPGGRYDTYFVCFFYLPNDDAAKYFIP